MIINNCAVLFLIKIKLNQMENNLKSTGIQVPELYGIVESLKDLTSNLGEKNLYIRSKLRLIKNNNIEPESQEQKRSSPGCLIDELNYIIDDLRSIAGICDENGKLLSTII